MRESAGADSAVFYYAGHGAQPINGGRNYLLPVDARVAGDDTLDTDRIDEQLERRANPPKLRHMGSIHPVVTVVGNASYTDRPLRNPENDAARMQTTPAYLRYRVCVLRNASRSLAMAASSAATGTLGLGAAHTQPPQKHSWRGFVY